MAPRRTPLDNARRVDGNDGCVGWIERQPRVRQRLAVAGDRNLWPYADAYGQAKRVGRKSELNIEAGRLLWQNAGAQSDDTREKERRRGDRASNEDRSPRRRRTLLSRSLRGECLARD